MFAAELAAAKYGKFERLDATIGMKSSKSDEDDELMKKLERQVKMNDIMINILKSRGLDFDEIIAVAAKMKLEIVNTNAKIDKKEKKKQVSKMNLKNQQKLGDIQPSNSTANEKSPEKVSNNSGKIKTAKDFEHYRKTKKPTRI